jgi:hypothetical protein
MAQWSAGLQKVKAAGAKMIPEAVTELHAKLLRLQQLVYRGEWHTVTPGTKTVTREAEGRLIDESEVAARPSAYGGWKQNKATAKPRATLPDKEEIARVYKWQEGYPDLMHNTGPTAFEKEVYTDIAAFSGSIRASAVNAGECMLRVHIPGSAVRSWWVRLPPGVTETNWREFMRGGKQWREVLAVLDEFSVNGAFSICRVRPGHSLKAWEGTAAEQFGMKNPGQYLPGGQGQLYLDTRSAGFLDAVEWLVKEGKTAWTDLQGVGYAAGNVKIAGAARVERLADDEDQYKRQMALENAR